MVERGHAAGVDPAVGQHAVPALPDRGGAHGHRVQPRRALGLQQQPVRDVDVPGRLSASQTSGVPTKPVLMR